MFFKNAQLYRLPAPWDMTAERLAEALAAQAFAPASSNGPLRQGWASPRENGPLVHAVNGQFLLSLVTEKKILPSKVINQVAKTKAAELEEQQGFPPGKKAMKELKERVADELLPRAFAVRNVVDAWIDPKHGWLVVNSASPSRADDVIKLLLKAVDRLPLESLRVQSSPAVAMTAWLESDDAPRNFTIDKDATLRAVGESKAQIGYKSHSLDPEDMRRHIAAGKQCQRLALTWNSRISFVLTDQLSIKSIKPLDILKENAPAAYGDQDERFNNDFTLMSGELANLFADLVEALGGEARA